jgi:Uma2 family endonuclease
MTALPKHKMTIDEFLAWSETQPKEAGRFELWDGEIIEKHGAAGTMNAQRSQHWEMKLRLAVAMFKAVEAAGIDANVAGDGASVPMPNNRLAEPDMLVYLGPKVARDALVVPNPIIVCEVLSPGTARFDMSEKLVGYFALESVQHYLIADPDVPHVIHHARGPNATKLTRIISDRNAKLVLDPPGLTVSMDDVLRS